MNLEDPKPGSGMDPMQHVERDDQVTCNINLGVSTALVILDEVSTAPASIQQSELPESHQPVEWLQVGNPGETIALQNNHQLDVALVDALSRMEARLTPEQMKRHRPGWMVQQILSLAQVSPFGIDNIASELPDNK